MPAGYTCLPVIVISPAIYISLSAPASFMASFEMPARFLLISPMLSASPYSASLILFPENVGAYIISVPASIYSAWSFIRTSLFSRIHSSGQTPAGMPRAWRLEPVAPSRIRRPCFNLFKNSSLVITSLHI